MTDPSAPLTRPLPADLTRRYHVWRETRFAEGHDLFARLTAQGQAPLAMIIQCCDSRVNVLDLFDADPGDFFVVRNVANLVPPNDPDQRHFSAAAAVEFAITALKIAHIIIVGHSNCGGVHACHDMCAGKAPQLAAGDSFIGSWVRVLRPGYDRVVTRVEGEAAQKTALEKEGVLISLSNLVTFPFVAEALARGDLSLHGAWIDIATGVLHVHTDETGFAPI